MHLNFGDKNIEKIKKKLLMFDLRYFLGKSHFEDNGAQNHLVFQLVF